MKSARYFVSFLAGLLIGCSVMTPAPDADNTRLIENIKAALVRQDFEKAHELASQLKTDGDLVSYEQTMFGWNPTTVYFPQTVIRDYIFNLRNLALDLAKVCPSVDSASTATEAQRTVQCWKNLKASSIDTSWDYKKNMQFNEKSYAKGLSHMCEESPQHATCSPFGTFKAIYAGNGQRIEHEGAEGYIAALQQEYLKVAIAKYDELFKIDEGKAIVENEQKLAKARAERESPEGLRKFACQTSTALKMAEKGITDEQEVGKISGVVSKKRLHEAGIFVQSYSRQLEQAKRDYKVKTGQDWSPSLCGP